MIYVTRRERFNSAHRLFRPDFSNKRNNEVFGKCSNPNWHGHNYELFVTVKGNISSETGFLVNIRDLSVLVNELVISKLDHSNINIEVDFMADLNPTTENLAVAIWNQLENPVKDLGAILHRVKLFETENNFVEYYGEETFKIESNEF
ncbi:MAG: 6-pyruvoyl tetrahydropterin synthase family protein [Bacteroidales bacterium]